MNRLHAAAGLVLIALAILAAVSLARLGRAEAAYGRATQAAALPRISVPSGRGLPFTNIDQARAALAQRIGDGGAAAGVRMSLNPTTSEQGAAGIATMRVVARGSEAGLLRFSAAVEQGDAMIRWTRWSIIPDGDGGFRLSADAAAPLRAR